MGGKNVNPFPLAGRLRISQALKGRPKTGSHKEALSIAAVKRWKTKPLAMTESRRLAIQIATLKNLPSIDERRRVRRLGIFLRNCVHRLGLNGSGYSRLQPILGYTREQLRERLESQFHDGMTWNNYGSEWNIDHIYPVSAFVRDGQLDPAVVNALSNLRPLWKSENFKKHTRIVA